MQVPELQQTPERISAFFIRLDKLVRGLNLYQGEGEVVARLEEELVRLSSELTAQGSFTVKLTPLGASFEGAAVTPSDRRIPYLFQLFCDGVRELSFLKGVTGEELRSLAGLFRQDPAASEEDLVTLIWQRSFAHIRYYAVDALALDQLEESQSSSQLYAEAGSLRDAGESGRVQLALGADDLRLLRADDRFQWVRSAYRPARPPRALSAAAAAACKVMSGPPDYAQFLEIVRVIQGEEQGVSPLVLDLVDSLVERGEVAGVAAVLRAIGDDPGGREALLTRARMERMVPLFERHHEVLTPALEPLVAGASDGMFALLNALPPGEALASMGQMLERAGVDMTPFHARKLKSAEEAEVLSAVAALGRIGSPEALKELSGALSSTLAAVRRSALAAMNGRYHDSARIGLGRVLRDPSRENRLMALELLGASGDLRVAWQLISAIEGVEFPEKDIEEQQALYAALARLKDPRTLEHFRKILDRKQPLSGRGRPTHQQLAARALGEMGIEEARGLIEEYKDKWYLPSAVKEELRSALASWGQP